MKKKKELKCPTDKGLEAIAKKLWKKEVIGVNLRTFECEAGTTWEGRAAGIDSSGNQVEVAILATGIRESTARENLAAILTALVETEEARK